MDYRLRDETLVAIGRADLIDQLRRLYHVEADVPAPIPPAKPGLLRRLFSRSH